MELRPIWTDWTTYTEPTAGKEGFGWVKTPNTYDAESVSLGSAERNLYYELQMQYNRSFEKHNVTAMAMFSRNQIEVGSNWPRKREDWVGRITYDYNQRYFLEINGAYNGSEKFGPDYRFDFFPSIAGGWLISEERFFKDRVNWMDKLKVRYSYGLVGNDNVNTGSTWPYLTIWNTYTAWIRRGKLLWISLLHTGNILDTTREIRVILIYAGKKQQNRTWVLNLRLLKTRSA